VWKTNKGRVLIRLDATQAPDHRYEVVPCFVSQAELIELGEAIADALRLTEGKEGA
jgi:hypothetical protein